jgi:hypothetical protein
MTDVSYIELLIESEKSEHKPDWIKRVGHLEEQKKLAVMIAESQDPNYNPWAKYEKEASYTTYVLEKAKKVDTFIQTMFKSISKPFFKAWK